MDLSTRLKDEARGRGFALAGVAPAADADGFAHFAEWLDGGYAGAMDYLHRNRTARQHPRGVLPAVRSVLMVGLEYGGPETDDSNARIAKYAQGPDYHRVIWDKLNDLAAWLAEQAPGCTAKAVTDTAPLLERDFARRAGLGWFGKNTMLINTRRGSFFFIGALLTDLELASDEPFTGSHCGTCTACLDACPTDAFVKPRVLDATKCISYLTIELRTEIPVELRPHVGNWLYGCDVCQDVCPWNRKAGTRTVAFPHDPTLEVLDPVELLGMDADAFRRRFKHTALWRNRRAGLLRNAAIVLGNTGDSRAVPALERAIANEEGVIREAAAWAIGRIRQRTSRVNSGLSVSSSA